MQRQEGYARREDEPTRPVRVPRLRLTAVDESAAVVDEVAPAPRREPTLKLPLGSRC